MFVVLPFIVKYIEPQEFSLHLKIIKTIFNQNSVNFYVLIRTYNNVVR